MPLKRGAGGRLQNYNPRNGRFTSTYYGKPLEIKLTRKEKAKKKEEQRRLNLYNKAKKSKDKYLFETYQEIERALPGAVQHVNEKCYDRFVKSTREFDIITKKCIIEIKSGAKVTGGQRQFLRQKRLAESLGKKHVVFAPNMLTAAKKAHERSGITIISDYKSLTNFIKEHEK